MKRRVQRGRAHCVCPERNTTRRFESLAAQHPKAAGCLRIRTLDIRPGEADTEHCPDTRARKPTTPYRGYRLHSSTNRCLSQRANRRFAGASRNVVEPALSRRPAVPEPRQSIRPKASAQSVSRSARPRDTWTPSAFPKESQVRQETTPPQGDDVDPTGRTRHEPFAPPTPKRPSARTTLRPPDKQFPKEPLPLKPLQRPI